MDSNGKIIVNQKETRKEKVIPTNNPGGITASLLDRKNEPPPALSEKVCEQTFSAVVKSEAIYNSNGKEQEKKIYGIFSQEEISKNLDVQLNYVRSQYTSFSP